MVRGILVKRAMTPRTAFLAGCLVVCACRAGGQTPPLRDPSVAQKPLTPLSATDPVVRDGLFSIDLVVADSASNPVSHLAPWDFTLLDNGQPAKIRTMHNSLEASEPAPELIFVLDAINLSSQQLTQTESAIVHFLRRNSGRQEAACFLYRLTRDGLSSSSKPTRDGNLLAKEVEQHKSPRIVWKSVRNDGPNLLRSWVDISQPNPLSLRALGSIAIDQREIAGRKVVVWISPGWPVNRGDIDFDDATELSTRLREARIMLDNVNVNPGQSFNYHDYLEAPRSQEDMQPAKLALPVIATHTGGLVLDSSGDLDRDIERCVEEERRFYTLTFNPPHTYRMDEFHELRVQVARPALTVRAPTSYYNEPVYFDNPRPGIERVTVAQLEELVHSKTDLRRKLANLELTERLSTPRLDALLSMIHGERERQALTADADLSFALAPPPDEIVDRPPPPVEQQRAVLLRTFDYLQNAIPKLPDFYASRNTVRFEEPLGGYNEIWKMPHQDQTLHFASEEHATVLYRNGHEVDEEKQKLGRHRVAGLRARGLETRGTFGPILAYVLTAAATSPSTLSWKRWERGKSGDLAVFSYKVASTHRVPELTYCCLPEGDGTTPYQNKADTYGEFALNPDTGAVLRIVINADLNEERNPDVPLVRSQIMVEYGPEELGGKTYICPQRSVEVSRGRSERQFLEWGMAFSLYSCFETMINDMTFGGYHKFGAEARVLPGSEETEETKTPTPPKKAH
jgi:VWFA-related protein